MRHVPTWILFTIILMMGIGWNATLPFVGVYLAVSRNTPLWVIGASYLVTGMVALGSQMMGGRLTDRFGPRRVMLLGYSGSVVAAMLLGYLITVHADEYLIAASYPLTALARGLCQPVPAAIVASTQRKDMMTQFSYLTIASNLAFAIGPAIGGYLSDLYNYQSVFYFTAAVFATTAVAATVAIGPGRLEETVERSRGKGPWLKWDTDRIIIILLVLAFFSFLVSGFDIQPLSLYSATFLHIPNSEIGILFSTNGLGVVLLQFPVVKLVERGKKIVTPLIAANLVCVVGFVLAASVSDFLGLELVMLILTVSEMLLSVPIQALMATLSSPETRGVYQGYSSATQNAGRTMASFVGPGLFYIFNFEPNIAWYAISLLAIAIAVLLGMVSPRIQSEYDRKRDSAVRPPPNFDGRSAFKSLKTK